MSHVDKGALHAYLDGALDEYPAAEAERIREHVDQCAQCAISLEAERRVRMDAQAILGMAAPEVEMPSLEELRAYVKRTRETRPAATTRIYRMGWAASVVLAVGAGWMLRGGQLQEAGMMSADFQRTAAEAVAPAGESELDDVAAPTGVAMGDEVVSEEAGGFAGAASSARVADAGARPAPNDASGANQAVPTMLGATAAFARGDELGEREDLPSAVTADRGSEATVAADVATLPATPSDAEKLRLSVAESVPGQPALDDAGSVVASAAMDVLAENASPPPAGGFDSVNAGVGASAPANVVAASPDAVVTSEPERAERRRAESFVPVTSALTRSTLSGQRQADEDEVLPSEEPALVAEGYDFVSMVNMGEGTTPVGVHVVQRYTADSTFEIFHLEAGVEMDALPPARPGDAMVRTRTVRGWIVVRGPLSETELREILDGLFPEPGIE